MKVVFGPHMKVGKDGIPHLISLTKTLRIATCSCEKTKNRIEEIGKSLAEKFENDPVLNDSLKNDPACNSTNRVLRQVDLKDDDGKIMLKAFVFWNKEMNCWHIFMELPCENDWENGVSNV